MAKYKNVFHSTLAALKALSDENRVRALLALKDRELCVCQIIELLELAPSTVSKHMSILKIAGLVESRKEGRWIFYRLPNGAVSEEIKMTLDWIFSILDEDERMQKDQESLKQLIQIDPEVLCKKQCQR